MKDIKAVCVNIYTCNNTNFWVLCIVFLFATFAPVIIFIYIFQNEENSVSPYHAHDTDVQRVMYE